MSWDAVKKVLVGNDVPLSVFVRATDTTSPRERLRTKGVDVVGGPVGGPRTEADLARRLHSLASSPRDIAIGARRAAEAVWASIADQERAHEMMDEYEDFLKFWWISITGLWSQRTPFYALVSAVVVYMVGRESKSARAIGMSVGKNWVVHLSLRSAAKSVISKIIMSIAKRIRVKGPFAHSITVGATLAAYQLLAMVEEAAAARRRLRQKYPALARTLRTHGVEMGWFLIEPHMKHIQKVVAYSGVVHKL